MERKKKVADFYFNIFALSEKMTSVPGSRNLLILYGSQTGTAIEISERIFRDAKRLHFNVRFMAMDDYPIKDLIEEHLVVFVCSTTGQGDEPDNMKRQVYHILD